MEANKITLKTLSFSSVTVLAMETVFRLVITGQTASSLPALGLLRCIEASVLVLIALRFEKNPGAVGLARSDMLHGITKGLLWSACFGVATGALFLILLVAGINALKLVDTPLPASEQQIFIFFLVGGVIGPVGEELFFRGIIYGFLRRWGVYVAIIISTLLFVFPHSLGSSLPITQIVGGIVFAAAYEKENSLMAPITIHCTANLTIFSLAFVISNNFFISW